VLAAGDRASPGSREALGKLRCGYWFPLYAFVRRQGRSSEDAEDLIQRFLPYLLERHVIDKARPELGRFRSFLLGCLKNYLAQQRDVARAEKHGGGRLFMPLDAADAERRLQVLHGTACTENSAKDGAEVARLVWHYDAKQNPPEGDPALRPPETPHLVSDHPLPVRRGEGRGAGTFDLSNSPEAHTAQISSIIYGQDVRDWWWRPEGAAQPTSARSRVVWTGSNPIAREKGYQLRLYLTTIENPRPQEVVRSLDYVSAMIETAPFLFALPVG
jgi:hypothetical protein